MTDMLPALLGPTPDTPAQRLDRYVRLVAVRDVIGEVEADLREQLEADADAVEAATGGAANVPVRGVGRMLRTDPAPRPVVVGDGRALTSWLAAEEPDLITWTERVDVVDHEIVAAALDRLASARTHGDEATAAAEAWNIADYLRPVKVPWLPEEPVRVLLDTGRYQIAGDVLVRTDDGTIVDGVEVRTQPRRLQLRPDPATRASYADTFRAALLGEVDT